MRPRSPAARVPAVAVLTCCLALGACGPRGEFTFMPEAAEIGAVETVLVATERAPGPGQPLFGSERAETLSFSRFYVSVPPDRPEGSVIFPPRQPADPRTDFVVVSAQRFADEDAFVRAINREVHAPDNAQREATLFVHGFNTNFAEGVYRQAQLSHDHDVEAASIHFAWPSAALTADYAYDRESALYSRDGLETAIRAIARSDARRFNLVAHSMGSFLLMETLRGMAREGDPALARLNAVVLISPDIDIDVFRRQARPVIARGIPIFAIVSSRDRALLVSAFIRGERRRVGSIASPEELGDVAVTVVDISNVDSADSLGHFAVATSPALINLFRGLRSQGVDVFGRPDSTNIIENSITIIQEGTQAVLAPLAE
jgi:esterase/lipase superfamily enzyme